MKLNKIIIALLAAASLSAEAQNPAPSPVAAKPTAAASKQPSAISSEAAKASEAEERAPLTSHHFDMELVRAEVQEDALPSSAKIVTLRDLMKLSETDEVSIRLNGLFTEQSFTFDIKADEIVSRIGMTLDYVSSPGLIPVKSHINVYLNGQVQKTIPISKEDLGKKAKAVFEMDPKLLKDRNRISVQFIGHTQVTCETPTDKTIWVNINTESTLSINTQKIRVENDLALLPVPFINVLTDEPTTLPVVFGSNPNNNAKKAAAVVASWGGMLASWRGADFPVFINELPVKDHFVVFITNESRPWFLKDYPKVSGPRIEVADAPNSSYAKMLIVAGRDENDLVTASKALATSAAALSGNGVNIDGFKELEPRKAYDAPNWVDTSKVLKFADLVQYPGQLSSQGSGVHNRIKLNFKLPPDIFFPSHSNVDSLLKYRYTPSPYREGSTQFRFTVNNKLASSERLASGRTADNSLTRIPVVDRLIEGLSSSSIPNNVFGHSNNMDLDFAYSIHIDGGSIENCKSSIVYENLVEVDPESTLDFTSFPHYAEMPNVGLFFNSGFPFSKYADLSETLVLISDKAKPAEISTLLNTTGRIASIVGYPALSLTVSDRLENDKAKDKDILVVGNVDVIPAIGNLKSASAYVEGLERDIVRPFADYTAVSVPTSRQQPATKTDAKSEGNLAEIVGYQSPFNEQRSVVALLSAGPAGSALLNQKLSSDTGLPDKTGNLCLFSDSKETCYRVGDTYFVGKLSLHQKIWLAFNDHPFVVAFFFLIAAVLLGTLICKGMNKWIKGRHEQ